MPMNVIWPNKFLNQNFVRFLLPPKSKRSRFRFTSLTWCKEEGSWGGWPPFFPQVQSVMSYVCSSYGRVSPGTCFRVANFLTTHRQVRKMGNMDTLVTKPTNSYVDIDNSDASPKFGNADALLILKPFDKFCMKIPVQSTYMRIEWYKKRKSSPVLPRKKSARPRSANHGDDGQWQAAQTTTITV